VDRWFRQELRSTWPLDLCLTLSAVLAVVTRDVILWFHVIFVLVTVAALVLPFARFVIRFVIWVSTCLGLLLWAVIPGDTPREELTELPLMSLIIIIVYIGAQARARALGELQEVQSAILIRTEAELDGLRHQLVQAQRLETLARASTTMAHDLRNLFVVVRGAASELDRYLGDDGIESRAKEILDATDRGMAMMGDLMAMGRTPEELDMPIDLIAATRQYEKLLRRLMPRNVRLSIVSTSEPILVWIDRTSLLQILMNLTLNSTESIGGSEGKVKITIDKVVRYQPGGAPPMACAQLTVCDDGAGISRAAVAEVFQPGFSTKAGEHSGLGLSTVHQIVERLNGSIELESSLREGTSIRIRLLLQEDVTSSDCDPERAPSSVQEPTLVRSAYLHSA
jgi:signal transduction histidine kinase